VRLQPFEARFHGLSGIAQVEILGARISPQQLYLPGCGALPRGRRSPRGTLPVGQHPSLADRAVDGGAPAARHKNRPPQRDHRGARISLTQPMETTESYRAARSAAQAGVPMPNILRLSDQQISELIALTKPLAPQNRDLFLQLFADAFRGRSTIDDGEFYR